VQVFLIEVEEATVSCEKVADEMSDLGVVDVDDGVIKEAVVVAGYATESS
jgi:hypothetical protein